MNTMDTIFSFELSPAELHWLAGACGITNLPVPETEGQEKSHLADGLQSLQERGLVRKFGSNTWQVDNLPFAVVQWLASAASLIVLEMRKRSGTSTRGYVFKDHGAAMYVTLEKNKYQFMLAPDKETMSTYVLDLLGVSAPEPGSEAANYRFSQPDVIFQTVWTDPAVAARMLKVAGLQPGETKAVLAWAGTLEWILSLKQFPLSGGEPERGCQAILCGTVNRCWAAHLDAADGHRVDFVPTDLQKTQAFLESQL
jgi:hypothetical protein